tara:strand:+ start:70 stop:276 length:207 start_codon:yes stop_codon:yes gene_type:complete
MQHLKDVLIDIGYTPQEADRELNGLYHFKRHDQKWYAHIDKDKDYQEETDKLLDEPQAKDDIAMSLID